jgi:hypothetical protein
MATQEQNPGELMEGKLAEKTLHWYLLLDLQCHTISCLQLVWWAWLVSSQLTISNPNSKPSLVYKRDQQWVTLQTWG